MGWELRNGRRYYYRSKRAAGGRVVKTYHGSGLVGALAADADAMKRADRKLAVERYGKLLERIALVTEPLNELCRHCDVVLEAALLAGGYHRRKGEWRKSHGRRNSNRLRIVG